MRRRSFPYIIRNVAFIYLSICISAAVASEFHSNKTITISKTDVISDDYYAFANYVEAFGAVEGDLSAFCYSIEARGNIAGNVNLFAFNIDLDGNVQKSARLFGYTVYQNGGVFGNVLALGNKVTITENATIGRDFTGIGTKIDLDGTVVGNADIKADEVVISGTIDGDVHIKATEISILRTAVIKGNLTYVSPVEAELEDGAVVEGEVSWEELRSAEAKEVSKGVPGFLSFLVRAILFAMTLLTGLIIILFFKKHTHESALQVQKRFPYCLAIGLLTILIVICGSLVLAVMVVGIPLSLLLIALGLLLFYVGKIYVSVALGDWIFKTLSRGEGPGIGVKFIVGLFVLVILFQIPVLGWIIYLLSFIAGMGAAVNGYIVLTRKYDAALESPPPKGA
jgi:cytoskeletal protein CcmA (bactofilin family)